MNLGELPKGEINLSSGRELGVPNALNNLDSSVIELATTLDELITRISNVLNPSEPSDGSEKDVVKQGLSPMATQINTIHDRVLETRTLALKTLQRLDI